MELTREKALSYHRQMWSDMQRDLGDEPLREQRFAYKRKWIKNHFPELVDKNSDYEIIRNNCFLCEYVDENYGWCDCPIDWPAGRCEDGEHKSEENWDYMPISELLALPERGVE